MRPQHAPNREAGIGGQIAVSLVIALFVLWPSASYGQNVTLSFATLLGGNNITEINALAVDEAGDIYVTGYTQSANFPVTAGAYQSTCTGSCYDAFVAKFDPTGSTLVYSTFLGGSGQDVGYGIALDATGDAYITGETYSSDFPTTSGTYQQKCTSNCSAGNVFVTELSSDGGRLIYSTYLGGSKEDEGNAILLDGANNAYVAGTTHSSDFPVLNPAQAGYGGGLSDAFITVLNSSGSALLYSTYLGGSDEDRGYSIALDTSGGMYVVGQTNSSNFPMTSGSFQTNFGGRQAGYLTKLDFNHIVYSTFLGGSTALSDPCPACATSVVVDSQGAAYVGGLTWMTNFPVTAGAYQTVYGGGYHDGFVVKLDPTGSTMVYGTYFGGSKDDGVISLALDAAGDLFIRGTALSLNLPVTTDAFQRVSGGSFDGFLAELDPTGSKLLYCTYFGGSGKEYGGANQYLVRNGSKLYTAGWTESNDFPTTGDTFQQKLLGTTDGFVMAIDSGASTGITLSPLSIAFGDQVLGANSAPQSAVLTNTGTNVISISHITASGDFTQTDTCNTTLPPGANCNIAVIFSPTVIGAGGGTLSVEDDDPGSPQTVSLSGTGTVVNIAPTILTFPSQLVGSTSSPQNLIVTNTGKSTLIIHSIGLSGINGKDFAQSNTCGLSLAIGASCTVSVTFTPKAKGTRTANLSIGDNGGGSPQQAGLSGTGK